jgi:hypothetical protein
MEFASSVASLLCFVVSNLVFVAFLGSLEHEESHDFHTRSHTPPNPSMYTLNLHSAALEVLQGTFQLIRIQTLDT